MHAVTDWLARGWTGEGPLDLSDTLLIAPTRQAGRRLREALAGYAAKKGQAVFPPRVIMPEALATLHAPLGGVATRTESLLAWTEVLREVEFDAFRDVFPIDPPARTFAWASRLAREFQRLQTTLAENGLRMRDVAGLGGGDFPEAGRWRQLGELEAACDASLAKRGLRDPQAAKIAYARNPTAPAEMRKIVLSGTPDPLPLGFAVLSEYAERGIPIDVLVSGPEKAGVDAGALFDGWGRPVAAVWMKRSLKLEPFEQRVRLCVDPAAQAQAIVSCAVGYKIPGGRLGVGVADADVLPPLENGLARAGVAAFNPEGRALRAEALHTLLTALAELVKEPTFTAVAALMRCPDVLRWLGGSAAGLLATLDELHAEYLPSNLDDARKHAKADPAMSALAGALDDVARVRRMLLSGVFPENTRAVLTEIFKERRFDLAREDDARAVEAAQIWGDVLAELEEATAHFPGLAPAEVWELALRALGDSQRFDEKPEGAVELQGWLELLWDDVPHLVVAGFNDGRVPDAVVGDAFLPEALRERVGLKSNTSRFARDAYLLQALAAFRADGRGQLDLLVGKTSAAGDPLRPSRLLFLCPDAELAARVAFLFAGAEGASANPAWRRAWKLTPRTDAKIERLSVTAFRDYLKCPFRFYLKHGLRMNAVDPQKAELDAMDFGNLCHAALEAMGRAESPVRDCTDAGVLRGFLLEELERAARARYGDAPVLPLVVQLESARQRLSKAAEVQAQLRGEGWFIERVETKFEVVIGGMTVRGKIDRIDRNELTGRVRVLDYKTSDKPVNPEDAHMRNPGRNEELETLPTWGRWVVEAGERIWIDMQLPFYLAAVEEEFGHAVECGYFNLPKAAGETGVSLWNGYDSSVQAAAIACAEGVIESVQKRRFWPPVEMPALHDDFAVLFQQDAALSVEWPETDEKTGANA